MHSVPKPDPTLIAQPAESTQAYVAQLETALQTNRGISVAVGIVAERYNLSADDAFQVLRQISQNKNWKLRYVAQEVVRTRQLPAVVVIPNGGLTV